MHFSVHDSFFKRIYRAQEWDIILLAFTSFSHDFDLAESGFYLSIFICKFFVRWTAVVTFLGHCNRPIEAAFT